MVWKVAPSYEHMDIIKVDEDARKALVSETCWKCGGSGMYAWFGTCFACNGTGHNQKWVKIYTEDEYNKYVTSQERARVRKAEAEEKRKQDLIDNSEANKKAMLASFEYDVEDPTVYIVVGDNTYEIKDELKAAGARFDYALGWYFKKETEVPEGYILVPIKFDKLFNWLPLIQKFEVKEDAKETVRLAVNEVMPESPSEYIGEIKERIRDLKVTLIGARTIDSYYGTTNIYTFKSGDNVIIWMTTSCQDIEVGDEVLLTGTVKSHDEYKGVKQTKMTRCIIKK